MASHVCKYVLIGGVINMASHVCKSKTSAKKYATRMRKKGYNSTVYPMKGKGWGVSVTRK